MSGMGIKGHFTGILRHADGTEKTAVDTSRVASASHS